MKNQQQNNPVATNENNERKKNETKDNKWQKRLSFQCKHIHELTVKQLHVFILSRTRSLSIMIMDVYCI